MLVIGTRTRYNHRKSDHSQEVKPCLACSPGARIFGFRVLITVRPAPILSRFAHSVIASVRGSVDGVMHPNVAGQMVEMIWRSLPDKFPSAALDLFQVMPNHLHFGIWVAWPAVAPDITPSPSLIQMMQWFKSLTTAKYRHGVKQEGWTRYPGKLWQRSYFDHIVRSQQTLDKIRHYIDTNPARWQWDRYNAQRVGNDSLAVEIWRMMQRNEDKSQHPRLSRIQTRRAPRPQTGLSSNRKGPAPCRPAGLCGGRVFGTGDRADGAC